MYEFVVGGIMNKFIVIDIETANPDLLSICQVGIVFFENGEVVTKWETLVNPRDYFDPINVSIHGITERDVRDAPILSDIVPIIKNSLVLILFVPMELLIKQQ